MSYNVCAALALTLQMNTSTNCNKKLEWTKEMSEHTSIYKRLTQHADI